MLMMSSRSYKVAWLIAAMFAAPFFTGLAQGQPTETPEMSGMCPMMDMGSGWMVVGMILTGLLTLAVISALLALTVFLVRRSGPRGTSRA
jgi:galactitol-specific phosphotransferase system IIC component